MSKKDKPTTKCTCHHCGYGWETTSVMQFVSCPRCHYKTPVNRTISVIDLKKSHLMEAITELNLASQCDPSGVLTENIDRIKGEIFELIENTP